MDYVELEAEYGKFFHEVLPQIKSDSTIVITGHINADMDAIASILAFQKLIKKILPESNLHMIIPSINRLSLNLIEKTLENRDWETIWPDSIDLLFLLDTNDPFMTEIPLNQEKNGFSIPIHQIIIIDHHQTHINPPLTRISVVIHGNTTSTAEIITEFYKLNQIKLEKPIAKLLLFGILTDSNFLRLADSRTLDNVIYLLQLGWELRDLMDELQFRPPNSERIARLKAASRIKTIHTIGEYLVIITPCNSYDASAAKGLIDLGADVSFVFAWEKKPNFRITARASTTVLQETKLDLSKVMERIGIQYGGSGGGHDGAAGCYGTIDAEDCIQAITPFLMEVIRPILEHKKVGE